MFEPYISSFPPNSQNNKILSAYGVYITDFSCAPALDTELWKGEGRNSFILVKQNVGLQVINLSVVFENVTGNIESNIRAFEALLLGKFTLDVGDGYIYQCSLNSIGFPVWAGSVFCAKEYVLSGFKMLPMMERVFTRSEGTERNVFKATVNCESTVPKTDCRVVVSGTFDIARKIITIGNHVFDTQYALTSPLDIDGINKTLKANGENCISKFLWDDFPYFEHGNNVITVKNATYPVDNISVTVQFYPTFL